MYATEIALFIGGLVLLVIGYRRNTRNLMATAALLLFLSGAAAPAWEGFRDGLEHSSGHAL
ncbi:hypothetical protein SAMN05428989_0236 [Pseudoxanthomonas sp. GM95]|uniref:hypothetical protein n=1 Tax=Pseudoxanthomonas sp. GM95 TaxID=1881043 RepID=UPI0008AC2D96|nr:hypothetical protein [Pseudoxanthomonas sp. GM95]SEK50293.1 hypothetical protein SAMN05428989_0236 [Pseudoxanthomonas sp. GM95]